MLDVVCRANSKGKNNKRIKSGVGTASRAELPHSFTLPGRRSRRKPIFGKVKIIGTLVNSPPYVFSRVRQRNREDGVLEEEKKTRPRRLATKGPSFPVFVSVSVFSLHRELSCDEPVLRQAVCPIKSLLPQLSKVRTNRSQIQ